MFDIIYIIYSYVTNQGGFMAISKDKTILQVIVHKNVKTFIEKYSDIFQVSVSEFCNNAICEKILILMNSDLIKLK